MIYYRLDALVKVHGKIRRCKIQYTVIVNIRTHGTTRGREMATQRVTKSRTARYHFWGWCIIRYTVKVKRRSFACDLDFTLVSLVVFEK